MKTQVTFTKAEITALIEAKVRADFIDVIGEGDRITSEFPSYGDLIVRIEPKPEKVDAETTGTHTFTEIAAQR